jgi:hypothetical protein
MEVLMARLKSLVLIVSIACAPVISSVACSSGKGHSVFGQGGSGTASTGSGGSGGVGLMLTSGATGSGGPVGPFSDFPSTPVVDPSAPANAGTLFGAADAGSSSGGPCLYEPEPDTLYPNNWLRPRFSWNAGTGENLFELRLHTAAETNDLVVYTANLTWTMPLAMWTALATDVQGAPITVTITGAELAGTTLMGTPSVGSSETITIAPAPAAGSIVYWTTTNTELKGFSAGDESVALVLQPSQVTMPTVGAAVSCIGCHTATPDGIYAGFTAQEPWSNVLASVEAATVGTPPPFLGKGALATLTTQDPLGIQTYSQAHWTTGDHVMITPWNDSPGNDLAWIDLEATTSGMGTSYGFLARTGDTNDVGTPTWSHDGNTIVYVSNNCELTGRLNQGFGHLYSVPYNNRKGGTATHISTGVADVNNNEYYPAFSPDDTFLAFNEIPVGGQMYSAPAAEVFVMPAAGGTATRLAANDPPACLGKTSPGITNSWPKWAPQVTTVGTKSYYWLIFSSERDAAGIPQLYITGVVVDGSTVQTYGALYLWNQPDDEHNHTPAWDFFMIPPPPTN